MTRPLDIPKELLKGLKFHAHALGFLRSRPKLWLLGLAPFVLHFLLFFGFVLFLHQPFFDALFKFIDPLLGQTENVATVSALVIAIKWVLRQILGLIVLFLFLLLVLLLQSVTGAILAAPLYEYLAQKTLAFINPQTSASELGFWPLAVKSIRFEASKALFLGLLNGLCFLLGFLPVVGLLFWIAGLCLSLWIMSVSYAFYPFLMQGKDVKEFWIWAKDHKWLLGGFGLLGLVPFATLVFTSLHVVGGVLLFQDTQGTPYAT